jgi:hypothetical protein
MDELKIKAAALEDQNVIAADKLLEAQEQVDTAMDIVNNATEIMEDATKATEMTEDTGKNVAR